MINENPFVNPLMEISQKSNLVNNAPDGTVVADRWNYNKIGSFQHTVSQDLDVPTFEQAGKIIPNSLRLNLTTPLNNIANTDECVIVQKLEGYRFREFARKPFDILFWVKASKVGTYCISLRNDIPDLSCVSEFTINVANTWEEKRITFPASPNYGTWNLKYGIGIRVGIVLMAGNNYKTTGNTWNNGYFHKTENQINGVGLDCLDFRITDFDIVDVNADRHNDRGHIEEYNLCRRYFRRYSNLQAGAKILSGIVDTNNQATFDIQCGGMAKISNVSISNMGVYDTSTVSNVNSISSWFASDNILSMSLLTSGGLTTSNPAKLRSANTSSYLDIYTI